MALAGEVNHVEARHEHGVYAVDLEMVLDAAMEQVQAIVMDSDGLHRLSSAIVESRRLSPTATAAERRRVVYRSCFLIYCFNAVIVEEIRFPAAGTMLTIVDPAESDFLGGESEWELSQAGANQTRIRFHSELKPRFWVPPVVGPWIIKRKMLAAARETGMRLEQLTAHE